jgi:hypothetical protein
LQVLTRMSSLPDALPGPQEEDGVLIFRNPLYEDEGSEASEPPA